MDQRQENTDLSVRLHTDLLQLRIHPPDPQGLVS